MEKSVKFNVVIKTRPKYINSTRNNGIFETKDGSVDFLRRKLLSLMMSIERTKNENLPTEWYSLKASYENHVRQGLSQFPILLRLFSSYEKPFPYIYLPFRETLCNISTKRTQTRHDVNLMSTNSILILNEMKTNG